MRSLSHLADHVLLQELRTLLARERAATAELLVHLAEVDSRRLYLAAAHPSMHDYCVRVLHMSEHAAFKRIRAARAARRFPRILGMLAAGRLHLSGVVILAPRLTRANADELLDASAHRTKSEIELLLAQRFPGTDVPTSVRELPAPAPPPAAPLAPGPVEPHAVAASLEPGDAQRASLAPGPVARAGSAPIAPGRFEVRFTLGQTAHDKLQYARELLGHAVPSGDIPQVIERALDELISKLERRVYAASARTRPQLGKPRGRYVPAQVRREVLRRDGRQCAFRSESGERCPSRTRLEFDHVVPVARGGETTAANLRLLCRAHNRHEADRVFGAGFMARKCARPEDRGVEGPAPALAPGPVDSPGIEEDLVTALRQLGFRPQEARRGLELSASEVGAPLETRLRMALRGLGRARFERSTSGSRPHG